MNKVHLIIIVGTWTTITEGKKKYYLHLFVKIFIKGENYFINQPDTAIPYLNTLAVSHVR